MWRVASAIVFALIVVQGSYYNYYKDLEYAPYTVVEDHSHCPASCFPEDVDKKTTGQCLVLFWYRAQRYMILSFPALTWATTTGTDHHAMTAERKAYLRLLSYMSGKNDRRQKMNMTFPLRMKTTLTGEEVSLEMSYLIPRIFANNPPNPKDKNITLYKEGPRMYAVRAFSRHARRSLLQEVEMLKNSLLDDDTIDKTEHYIASFEGPFPEFSVEIWLKKMSSVEIHEIA